MSSCDYRSARPVATAACTASSRRRQGRLQQVLVEQVLGKAVLGTGEHGRQLVGLAGEVVDTLHLGLDGVLRLVRQLKHG